jgi:hypothetical protein
MTQPQIAAVDWKHVAWQSRLYSRITVYRAKSSARGS